MVENILPTLGPISLQALTAEDVAKWVQTRADRGLAGKTMANKLGFLSSALNVAASAGHIKVNPAVGGARLIATPRTEREEMVFLTRSQYRALDDEIPEQ